MAKKFEVYVQEYEHRLEQIESDFKARFAELEKEYKAKINPLIEIAKTDNAAIQQQLTGAQQISASITAYYKKLISEADSENKTIEDEIDDALEKINDNLKELETLSNRYQVLGDSIYQSHVEINGKSVKEKVYVDKFENLPSDAEVETGLDEKGHYYIKITTESGLRQDIEELHADANAYFDSMEKENKALHAEINRLLTGATNAGLARAYAESRDKYVMSTRLWTIAFIASVICLAVIPFLVFKGVIYPAEMIAAADPWDALLKRIILALPLVIPVLWFAIHSCRASHAARRLGAEYQHKWSVATSFLDIRKQINELADEEDSHKDTLENLLNNTISAHSNNPSNLISREYESNFPLYTLFDRLGLNKMFRVLNITDPGDKTKVAGTVLNAVINATKKEQ